MQRRLRARPRMKKLLYSSHARFRRYCSPLSIQAKSPSPISRAIPTHSLVLTLRLFSNECSPFIAVKAGTEERDILDESRPAFYGEPWDLNDNNERPAELRQILNADAICRPNPARAFSAPPIDLWLDEIAASLQRGSTGGGADGTR